LQKEKSSHSSLTSIVIDAVFFQLNQTGIARVWRTLLEEWSRSDIADRLIVVDRADTAPKVKGIKSCSIEPFDYRFTGADSQRLQEICDRVGAGVFISTYYTTPLTTPSVFMAYDMVPEAIGLDLTELCWQEKCNGILHASRYISISNSTARDLCEFYPCVDPECVSVAYCGVSQDFTPASISEIRHFQQRYDIHSSYFLWVGTRLTYNDYKNSKLFFQSLSLLSESSNFAVVCVGGTPDLEPELLKLVPKNISVKILNLDDSDLRLAYSGAIALVYPSRYEGFGLPILEAMACGCPVITCRNSSIPEVAGEAALYVGESSVAEMSAALESVQYPEVRETLIQRGLQQASKFSWAAMADTIAEILLDTAQNSAQYADSKISALWQALRREQAKNQRHTDLEGKFRHLQQENEQLLHQIDRLEQRYSTTLLRLSRLPGVLKRVLKRAGLRQG
jgi:glycosyltransferase involved in cell wall biosynthesis